jgi:hypothetical protein
MIVSPTVGSNAESQEPGSASFAGRRFEIAANRFF